jgi:hypothetical protein
MRRALLLLLAACNQLVDAEAELGDCDREADFIALAPVPGLEGQLHDQSAWLSPDELTVVFSRRTVGPPEHHGDLYVAHRDDLAHAFGAAAPLAELNTEADEYSASLTSDLLTIYFDRQDADGAYALFSARRDAVDQPFGTPVPVSLHGWPGSNFQPFVAVRALFFSSAYDHGTSKLYEAPGGGSSFGTPAPVFTYDPLPFLASYENPIVTPDGRELYYSVPSRPNVVERDIWHATRSDDGAFTTPHPVTGVNADSMDYPAAVSADNCRLYFITDRGVTERGLSAPSGRLALWVARRRE